MCINRLKRTQYTVNKSLCLGVSIKENGGNKLERLGYFLSYVFKLRAKCHTNNNLFCISLLKRLLPETYIQLLNRALKPDVSLDAGQRDPTETARPPTLWTS